MFKVQATDYFTIRCLGQMFEVITLLHLLLLNITILFTITLKLHLTLLSLMAK